MTINMKIDGISTEKGLREQFSLEIRIGGLKKNDCIKSTIKLDRVQIVITDNRI